VPLRSSAQNQEFRPLSDEKPGSTFSESGLDTLGLQETFLGGKPAPS